MQMNASEPYIEFNYDKFVDAVHFICEIFAEQPEALGHVKLHKILYYADMTAFFETGLPLTGVEYQKQPYGPTARHLAKALKDLQSSNRLSVSKRDVFGYQKVEFKCLAPAISNRLNEHERDLLRAVSRWAGGMTAVEISELSHTLPWQSVRMGERIDYASAGLLFPQKFRQADIDWVNQAAKQITDGQARVRLPA